MMVQQSHFHLNNGFSIFSTASRTATMHKHFAVAVIFNIATFMIGITLTFNEVSKCGICAAM